MPWYFYLGASIFLVGLLSALVLSLPLRIFIRYLRKNKKDQATLTVTLSFLELQTRIMREGGQTSATFAVKVGRLAFRVPVTRTERMGRKTAALKVCRWKIALPPPDPENLKKVPELFRRVKPIFKKMTWQSFNLEMIFGLEDPALTGMAAGGCWALGGVLLGLMKRYFRFETVPKIKFFPQFYGSSLQVLWEGEMAMPLFRWLKLWFMIKTYGGAVDGKSSH
jgi:hypothetical protein